MKNGFFRIDTKEIFNDELSLIFLEYMGKYTVIDFVYMLYKVTSVYVFRFSPLSEEARVLSRMNHAIWQAKKGINNPREESHSLKKIIPSLAVPLLINALQELKAFPSLNQNLISFIDIAVDYYDKHKSCAVKSVQSTEAISTLEKDIANTTVTKNPVYGMKV